MALPVETRLVEVLLWHDEPILYVVESRAGQRFLVLYADDHDEQFARHLYLPVSAERLAQLKSGRMALRESFLDSEDGLVYLARQDRHSGKVVGSEARLPGDVPEELLPLPEARLELDTATLPRRAVPLDEAARKQRRTLFDLSLFLDRERRTEAPARLLGLILARTQETVASIAQALVGEPTASGVIPRDVAQQASLAVIGVSYGSFKVELAVSDDDMFQQTGREALDRFVDLVGGAEDPKRVRSLLRELGRRTVSRFTALLKLLNASKAGLGAEVASHTASGIRSARLEAQAAGDALAVVQQVEQELSRAHEVEGRLMGASLISAKFELVELQEDGKTWRGKIDEAALEQVQHATLGEVYFALIREEVEVDPITDEERPSHFLERLQPRSRSRRVARARPDEPA